jgi:hypothetical protein
VSEKLIELDETTCRMGKYSNNLEKHGDEDVPAWQIPFDGVMLTREQVNALYDDEHTDRAWFNQKKGGLLEPMPWTTKGPLYFADKFDGATVSVEVSGERLLEFEDCRFSIETLEPQVGGLTKTKLQIQVHPDDKQLVLIHQHQNREVKLSIADAKVALKKKSKQAELPLGEPNSDSPAGSTEAQNGAAAPGYDKGRTIETRDGAKTELRSAKEIDDEMKAKAEGKGGHPLDGIGPKTRAEIEKANKRGGRRTIDGRKGAH